jgi:chitin disaccharide deacetylase
MTRHLIVNADDFGASVGVNRGIVHAHRHGIVTSTSMTVTGQAAKEAAALSRDHPELAIGLHWDVWGEDEREFDTTDVAAVRDEFARQLDGFERLLGRPPTHVDSHRHAHLEHGLLPVFMELVEPLGVPLRGDDRVRWVGGFYGQWEWKVTDLTHVSVEALVSILTDEVGEGWTEVSCHPAFVTDDYLHSVYLQEREVELATLCAPEVRASVDELGIRLVSYADCPQLHRTG